MAQIRVKSYDQLWQAMDSMLLKGIDYAGYIAEDIVRRFIMMWYDDYDPKRYQRQFQLLQSLFRTETKIETNNSVVTTIYLAPLAMHHIFHDKAQQLTEYDVLEAANLGLHGALGGTVMPSKKGIKIWDDTVDYITQSKELITEFVRYLRYKGYDIRIK